MKLGHVAVSVSNLKRSVAFYRRYFGLRQEKKLVYADKGFSIALLKQGDICLELFEFIKRRPLPKYRRNLESDLVTVGVKHFSFEFSDIEKAYRRFRTLKVVFATDVRKFDNGARYFFIKDPDGNLIEIMESLQGD